VQSDHSIYTAAARRERAAMGIPPALLVEVSIKGPVEYPQYCHVMEMRDDPRKAMIAHFHGPLTIGLRTINWKVPEQYVLKTGANPSELCAVVGTMSQKHGCWVVVGWLTGSRPPFPKDVRPVVEIAFPTVDPKSEPVRRKYELKEFC
jgi:hypothetical protein